MTFEEKQTFLESYRTNLYRAKGLANELKEWQQAIGPASNPMQPAKPKNSSGTNQIEQHFVVESDLFETIRAEIVKATANRKRVLTVIFAIEDKTERNLIRDKYVYFLSNNAIAESISIDPRTVSRRIRKIVEEMTIEEDYADEK